MQENVWKSDEYEDVQAAYTRHSVFCTNLFFFFLHKIWITQ